MEYVSIVGKTVFFYFFIIIIYRIMGKREIGELGIVDLIISILIADIAVIGIEDQDRSIWMAVLPIVVLVFFQIVMSFTALKSNKFRNTLDGKPSIIIDQGKVNRKEMVKQRYNLDDLLGQVRERGITCIGEIEYAILETSGNLSIFPYKPFKLPQKFPLPVITDGEINREALKAINRDEVWVYEQLAQQKLNIENVFYAVNKSNKLFTIKK